MRKSKCSGHGIIVAQFIENVSGAALVNIGICTELHVLQIREPSAAGRERAR